MTPIDGQPILTAADMRAAEHRAIAAGSSMADLMLRAGAGVAEATRRLAVGAPVLVLCGPGNNGGDGYVAARILRANGVAVRVAALGQPKSEAAMAARDAWSDVIEQFPDALPEDDAYSPVVIDGVFGTGLSRPIEEGEMRAIDALVQCANLSIAIDLPSGVDTDTGAEFNPLHIASFSLTLALGALKPAHILHPSASLCGATRVIDIGLDIMDRPVNQTADWTLDRPYVVSRPQYFTHKYNRGVVVVIGGAMPGAAALAAEAAMHSGAGYVILLGEARGVPHALVERAWSGAAFAAALEGKSPGNTAVVVGPGLGKGDDAAEKLHVALSSDYPLVIDGDALRLLDDTAFATIKARPAYLPVVLTPHSGEFTAVFGEYVGSKLDAARTAAARSGAVVVFKGADTIIAYPDGRTRTATGASAWLSTAGTGDVLAGVVATMLASSMFPVEVAVWMHAEAARRLGGPFIADDLARALAVVQAAL